MSDESTRDIGPTPPAPPAKQEYPFKVLAVFATAVRMTRRNFPLFLVLAAVMVLPSLISQYVNPMLGLLGQSVASAVATSFVSYAVIMDMNGSQQSLASCLAQGFASFWRVLAVSILSGLVIFAAVLLLIVPGIIVGLMFMVIVPVTVIEGLSPGAAMKRSRELTYGRKGDLFALAMLVGLLFVPLMVVVVQLDPAVQTISLSVASSLFSAFMSVVSAVVYVVLRQIREGTKVPELATAFARIVK